MVFSAHDETRESCGIDVPVEEAVVADLSLLWRPDGNEDWEESSGPPGVVRLWAESDGRSEIGVLWMARVLARARLGGHVLVVPRSPVGRTMLSTLSTLSTTT